MAVKPPVRISQKIIIPLSALLILFASFSFFGYHGPGIAEDKAGKLFTSSRVPSGEHFLNHRRKTCPMWVYQGLHAAPAMIWSIAMPLQHVDSLRKRWPALHRVAGYVALSLSLLLSATGYWFFLSKNAYTHENKFHMHRVRGIPLAWPTFELGTYFLAPFYWLTMYKTAATARAKDFARHRRWAVLHTICGSIIAAERFGIVVMYSAAYVLSSFPQDKVHEFFGVGHSMEEIAAAELSEFAFANVIALVTVLSWLAYEFGRAGYFDGVKDSLASRNTQAVHAKKVE